MFGYMFIGFYQEWPVVQTAFFLAELLILSMKIHSYIMTNREYDKEYEKHQQKIPMGKVEKNEGKLFQENSEN